MTELQAQEFIKLLQNYYPKYIMPDDEYAIWCKKLKYYDFNKAKQTLSELMMERTTVTNTPPNGLILKKLNACAKSNTNLVTQNNGPKLWLELRRPDQDLETDLTIGLTFSCINDHTPEEYEERAVIITQRCKKKYGFDYIIIRHWEKFFQSNENEEEILIGKDAYDLFVANTLNLPLNHKRRIWLDNYLHKTLLSNPVGFVPDMKKVTAASKNINHERNKQIEALTK